MRNTGTRAGGFTLVEVLIAITMFLTLMAGVTVLFTGTLNTVRGSEQMLDVFEEGRGAMDRIEADLKGAFTAPEYGDFYNFYGTPFGFVYVGTVETGQLARVTYALHPNAETEIFRTTIVESWSAVHDSVVRNLVAKQVATAAQADLYFQDRYPDPDGNPAPPYSREPVEFEVEVTTWSLVRFEERGMSDLDSFILPNGIQFPRIDPMDPAKDEVPQTDSTAWPLYVELIDAISSAGTDMRLAIRAFEEGRYRPAYLRDITYETVEALLQARKRELWIRLVGGERIGNIEPWFNDYSGTVVDTDPTFWPLNAHDWTLSDGVMRQAALVDPLDLGEGDLMTVFGLPVDAVNVLSIFSYGDGNGHFSSYFNTPINVQGYEFWQSGGAPDMTPAAILLELDDMITDARTRDRRAYEALGSPLLPKLPAIVGVDFSISRERRASGVQGDFRRRFAQMVDIPTAINSGELAASLIATP